MNAADFQREEMEVDVLIVGAGPAGLSCALRLAQLIRQHGPGLSAENICVIEKAEELGMHSLSGAVIDPRALAELLPDFLKTGAPLEARVNLERLLFLTMERAWKIPLIPGALRQQGHYVGSIGRLVQWLGNHVQECGANIFTGFAGARLLIENGLVVGVYADDKGLDRAGVGKANFQPGYRLRAKLTILAEGAHGSLSKELIRHFDLSAGRNPQSYSLGLKELWELPEQRLAPGEVWHTLGYPLGHDHYGGGWIYGLQNRRVSLGLMVGLQYRAADFDPHSALQHLKCHPVLSGLLKDAKLLRYGAKTVPAGGYWSAPQPWADGALLIGDAAGLFDTRRLKGVHLAMKSGMLAAETAFELLQPKIHPTARLVQYQQKLDDSWIGQELWRARNHRQGFIRGLWPGMWHSILQSLSGGRGLWARYPNYAGHSLLQKTGNNIQPDSKSVAADGKLTFDKPSSLYHSGVRHEEDQPPHLHISEPNICHDRCTEEYGNPCQRFCPAGVYEMIDAGARLKINAQNCIHCKTCDIMDPYQIITWVPPEGGGGPRYDAM